MEKFDKYIWPSVTAISGAIFLYVLSKYWPTSSSSSEWAAWIQAVGSVGAIYVAAIISSRGTHRAEKRIDTENNALKAGVLIVAKRANFIITQVESGAIFREVIPFCVVQHHHAMFIAFVKKDAEEIHEILAAIPIDRLAGTGLIEPALKLRLAMSELIQQAPFFAVDDEGRLLDKSKPQFQKIKNLVSFALGQLGHGPRNVIDMAKG
jgi:hypothetical protein